MPGNQAIQCSPRHELHGDEIDALVAGDVVDCDDAGVIERRRGLRLQHQATAIEAGCALGRKNLDRNEPVQVGVAGLVDDAHSALAEHLQDLEVAERLTDHGGGLRRVRIVSAD